MFYRPDHLGPLLGFVGNELAELGHLFVLEQRRRQAAAVAFGAKRTLIKPRLPKADSEYAAFPLVSTPDLLFFETHLFSLSRHAPQAQNHPT
jgi:hypothetical protein